MAKSQNKLSPHAPQKQQKAQIEIGKRSKPAGDRQSPQTLSHPSGRGILTRRIWGLHLELGAGILELGAAMEPATPTCRCIRSKTMGTAPVPSSSTRKKCVKQGNFSRMSGVPLGPLKK